MVLDQSFYEPLDLNVQRQKENCRYVYVLGFFFYKTNDFSCFLMRNHFVCSFCSQVFLLQYLAKKHHKPQVTLDRLIRQCRIYVSKSNTKSRQIVIFLAQLEIRE